MAIGAQDPRPSEAERRWFGLLLLATFGILGAVDGCQLESHDTRMALIGVGLALFAAYYAIPPLRVPLYRGWMALVMPLGRGISLAVLAVIYFLVVTPIATLLRAFGRDAMLGRFDASADSYWIPYDSHDDADGYFRQS